MFSRGSALKLIDTTIYNPEAPVWVRRGPYLARRVKALKASHVWTTGGTKAQAKMPTGDVLGGLPPKQLRGLRGGPAQRQRTKVGRIRSCFQGRTGLDDCCEQHDGTGGSRGERKPPITPGDVKTFANPTCAASARLVNLYSSSYVCEFALFCLFVYCSSFYCWATHASRCFSLCLFTSLFFMMLLLSPFPSSFIFISPFGASVVLVLVCMYVCMYGHHI